MKSILSIILIAWTISVSALAYNYPIGIPTAWIEPDVAAPARPVDWSSEVDGYYFISYTSGTDTGRANGTPSAPRKTIPAGDLPAGSRVEISGNYHTTEDVTLRGMGTDTAWVANTSGPVWFIGSSGNRASFDHKIVIRGECVIVDGVDNLYGGSNTPVQFSTSTSGVGWTAKKMMLRNSEFYGNEGTPNTCIRISTNSDSPSSDIIVYDVEVHGYGPTSDPPSVKFDPISGIQDPLWDADGHSCLIGAGVIGCWVLDSKFHDIAGTGVVVTSQVAGVATAENIFVARNEVYATWGAGIACKTAKNVVFSQNLVHDIKWTAWTGAKCYGSQYNADGVWAIFNHGYNGDLGFKVGSSSGGAANYYVIGNVFHDIQRLNPSGSPQDSPNAATITVWSGQRKCVIGNTIYDSDSGIGITDVGEGDGGTIIANNIITDTLLKSINIETNYTRAVIKNNLAYDSDGSAEFQLGVGGSVGLATFNGYANVSDTLEADPLFTSVGTGPTDRDLSILTGSPAKDTGVDPSTLPLDVFQLYRDTFGVDIEVDYNRGVRPAGAGWDIGAYEFGAEIPDAEAPVFTVNPSITGTATEGQTLTGNRGTITGVPSPAYYYQWIRCDAAGANPVDIVGATGMSYTLAIADVGSTIRFKVTATNSEGSANQTSAQTGVVVGTTVAAPTFSPENHITFPSP